MARAPSRIDTARPHIPDQVTSLDDVRHYSHVHRISGLADGVFSIAMTLLVLELVVPGHGSDAELLAKLDDLYPKFLVYAMSFVILGAYWVGHAIQFHYVIRADRPLMVRTVMFLMLVSLVPFSTAFLGDNPTSRVTIGFYALNLALCGMLMHGMLLYATKDPLMLNDVFDKRIFRGVRIAYVLGPALYVVAFLVALVSPLAGFVICIAVPLLTFFPNPFWGKIYSRFTRRGLPDDPADKP